MRFLHPTHSREKENKRELTILWVFIVSETLMYTTAVRQRKSIQTFLLHLLPPFISPPLSFPPCSPAFLSFCLIDVADGEAKIPAFCSFREELQRGQGATLGKVTDERAVEEGGGEVALKEGGGTGKIDHRVKEPLKDSLPARKRHRVTSHDQETLEKPRERQSLD